MTKVKAKELGVALDFFQVRKRNNPEQHKFMMSFDEDEFVSYDLYLKHLSEVAEEARGVYTYIEDNRLKSGFGKFLVEKGVYDKPTAYRSTEKTIFVSGITHYNSLKRIKRSNELFDQFIN